MTYDIPPAVREELLRRICLQVGVMQFKDLVDALGEDGVIELALNAGAAQPVARESIWSRAFKSRLYQLPAFICFPFMALLYATGNPWFITYVPGIELPEGIGWFGFLLLAAVRTGCFLLFSLVVQWIGHLPTFNDACGTAMGIGAGITAAAYAVSLILLWFAGGGFSSVLRAVFVVLVLIAIVGAVALGGYASLTVLKWVGQSASVWWAWLWGHFFTK